MRLKIYLFFSLLSFGLTNAQKRCNVFEVPLEDRVVMSSLIVEGRVKSSHAKWDNLSKNIYTIHEIEVFAVLKGFSPSNIIYVATPGGTIGFKKHTFSKSLNLEEGNTGVFMLKPNTYNVIDVQLVYEVNALSQGFIKYLPESRKAKGVFDNYESIENDLFKKIESKTRQKVVRQKAISWDKVTSRVIEDDIHNQNNRSILATSISSFSPTTVQAGRDTQLTITGTGFGSTQGTSYVAFKNADDGGSTYLQAKSNQYVSWSDTQIVVKVPSFAGTGTIRVNVGGTNYTSSGTLTVEYAISGFDYTYNSVTYDNTALLASNNSLGGYTFKYTTNVPTNGKTYFETAVKDWRCNSKVHFLVSSTTSSLISGTGSVTADDNENTVHYSSAVASGTIAQAITRSSGCVSGSDLKWYVDEIDVEVNNSLSFYYGTGTPGGTQYDYYTAVLHELGHANQLGHVIDATKVMHYSLGAGSYNRTIDTAASTGASYWVTQSTSSSNCGSTAHSTMNCTSTVSISASATSISENGGSLTITATQNQKNYSDVVVSFSLSGTATSGTDYTLSSITIPAGSLSATGTFSVSDDSIYEGNETAIIDVSSVTNATENGTQQVTITINDNESAPTVSMSVDVSSFTEGSGTNRTLTFTLSSASATTTTINLSYSGTATKGTDYTANTSATISAGATSTTLTITNIDDTLYEGTETIIVDISSVTNATENGNQQVTINYFDNDSAPTVTLSATPTNIAEASGSSTITATLSAVSGLATTVTLTISGTAETTDYSQATSIVIPAGSTTATITCTAIQDTIDEANETVISDITAVTNGTESGTQKVTITITDDDASPTITIASTVSSIAENGGTATITATSSAISEQDITILYSLSGTATNATDYSMQNNYIFIAAGSTSSSVNPIINAINDSNYEGNETIIFDVSSVTNSSESGTQQLTFTLVDDDIPSITLSSNYSSFGEVGSTVTITATSSIAISSPITVNLAFSGTATYNTDYSVTGITITIPANSTTGTVTLSTIDDTNKELDETIIVDITSVTNGTENGTQQVTMTLYSFGDDITVTLSKGTSTITESSGSTTFTATLSGTSYQNVTVDLAYSGTATLTSDYTRTGTSITIPAGSTSGSVTVTAVEDTLDEDDETIIADISLVTNGTENGTQQQTVSITDNDALPTATITWSNSSIGEGPAGTSSAIVTLSALSGRDVTVNLSWSGTATLNTDYTVTASSITIPAGNLSGYVTMNNIVDTLDEGSSESIGVTISSVTNATIGNPSLAFMTQNDDDAAPTVSFASTTSSMNETSGTSILTFNLSAISGLDVTINLAFTGTATSGIDYAIPVSSLVIPAGQSSGTITLTSIGDLTVEGNETIITDISSITNGTENGTQTHTSTITDDDYAIVNLKLFIEGYYDTSIHNMRTVEINQGVGNDSDNVDDISVELRDASTGTLVASVINQTLEFDGNVTLAFSNTVGNYYIVVKHRNGLETWSATPQTIGSSALTYDFTTAANKAYGNNQVLLESGVYGIYSGDTNQDGFIDSLDITPISNDSDNFAEGYQTSDINGDGFVDALDLPVVTNNADNFIEVLKPFTTNRRKI